MGCCFVLQKFWRFFPPISSDTAVVWEQGLWRTYRYRETVPQSPVHSACLPQLWQILRGAIGHDQTEGKKTVGGRHYQERFHLTPTGPQNPVWSCQRQGKGRLNLDGHRYFSHVYTSRATPGLKVSPGHRWAKPICVFPSSLEKWAQERIKIMNRQW